MRTDKVSLLRAQRCKISHVLSLRVISSTLWSLQKVVSSVAFPAIKGNMRWQMDIRSWTLRHCWETRSNKCKATDPDVTCYDVVTCIPQLNKTLNMPHDCSLTWHIPMFTQVIKPRYCPNVPSLKIAPRLSIYDLN